MTGRGQSIVLIGFTGVGKTSTGRVLAERTGLPCFDTDEMVSQELGMTVGQIFATHGEARFRECETNVLGRLNGTARSIIVGGGGIVLHPENVRLLQELGRIVWLEAEEATLLSRIPLDGSRPLLQTEDPASTLRELLRVRKPLYRQAADLRVDTSNRTVQEVAEMIIQRVEEK